MSALDRPETRLVVRGAVPAVGLTVLAFACARLATDPVWKRFFDNVHWTVSEAAGAALAWLAVRGAEGLEREVRRRIALALTGYAFGQLLWDLQVATGHNPFPAPADLFFLYGGLGCVPAFWVPLRACLPLWQRRAAVLDAAALSVAGLSLSLAMFLPMAADIGTLQLIVFVLYPTVLLGAAAMGVVVLLNLQPRHFRAHGVFVLALVGTAMIWLAWNKLTLLHEVRDGTWFNGTFSLLALTLGITVAFWRMDGGAPAEAARVYELLNRLLPLIVVALAGLADVLVVLNPQTDAAVAVSTALLSLVVIVLAVMRQSLLLSESDRLLEAERRAAENESRFRRLSDSVSDVLFRYRIGTRQFEYVSAACEPVLGFSAGQWQADPTLLRKRIRQDHRQLFDEGWRQIRRGKGDVMREYPLLQEDGPTRWISLRGVGVRDEDGRVLAVEGIVSDITPLKHSEERFAYLAHHDSLTALPNRLLFEIRLEQALARAQRHGKRFAVLFIDLDQFKTINEGLGHEVGDRLLVEVSSRMQARMRREDTLARWGGDEFMALIEDLGRADDIAMIAQGLLDAASTPVLVSADQTVALSASVGVSLYPDDSHAAQELIRNADTAMFAAKHRGGSQPCFYSAAMTEKARERLSLRSGLRRALDRGELFLVYQPILDVASDRIVGAEALLRWRHRDQLIPPDQFIPVAESSGLINLIGAWVLNEACRQGREWALRDPQFNLSVNVSPRQLNQLDFGKLLRETLRSTGMPAGQLTLEMTESTMVGAGPEAQQVVGSLRRLGVGIAVDDFGTGLSSLSTLKHFDVDRLKIDKSFVRDIPGDTNDKAIAATIVAMAQNLGLGVTAEGVETVEQLDFLRLCTCDRYQGFLFSPGVEAARFEQMLLAGDPMGARQAAAP